MLKKFLAKILPVKRKPECMKSSTYTYYHCPVCESLVYWLKETTLEAYGTKESRCPVCKAKLDWSDTE